MYKKNLRKESFGFERNVELSTLWLKKSEKKFSIKNKILNILCMQIFT